MHLDIPFYPNISTPEHPDGLYCQEMSLKMILGYFLPERSFTLDDMKAITGVTSNKAAWEMQFSLWFVEQGLEFKHFSKFDYNAFKARGLEYIADTYGQETADWQEKNSDVEGALKLTGEYQRKITVVPRNPTTNDIQQAMKDGWLVRAAIDSGFLNKLGRYVGHSVVITGYDDTHIWFHDPGLPAQKNRKVSQQLFMEAMDSFGNEMDIIKLPHK